MLHEGKIRDKPGISRYFTVLFSGVGTPISPLFTLKSPPLLTPPSSALHPYNFHASLGWQLGHGRAGSCGAGRVERLFYCGSCFVRGVGCVRAVAWSGSNAPCRALGRACVGLQLRGGLAALREVAPCLNAQRVQAVRWQLHPRVQSLRLGKLRLTLAFVCSTIKA